MADDDKTKVVDLAAARKAREKPKKPRTKVHVAVALGLLEKLREDGQELIFIEGLPWLCENFLWRHLKPNDWKAWAKRKAEEVCKEMNIKSDTRTVREAHEWIERQPDLFRAKGEITWDSHGKIATESGLVDIATGAVEKLRRDHYATSVLSCRYDPRASRRWTEIALRDSLPGEDEVAFFWEIFGSFLWKTRPRSMRRALVLVGESYTGKTTLLDLTAGFFSSEEPNTTAVSAVQDKHGTMAFLYPVPWIVQEAFDQGLWNFSTKVKAILSEDTFDVDIKNGPRVTAKFREAIAWGSNVPPQFRESSKAMQTRLGIINLTREFTDDHPVGAWAEAKRQGYTRLADFLLDKERSGILNGAIEGLQRLIERGKFDPPKSVVEAGREMYLGSNVAAKFMAECVEFDPASMVWTTDFCGALVNWWTEEHDRERPPPSPSRIGQTLQMIPGVITGKQHNKHRVYAGIKLNDRGLDHWSGFSGPVFARGEGKRISDRVEVVNRAVPSLWEE